MTVLLNFFDEIRRRSNEPSFREASHRVPEGGNPNADDDGDPVCRPSLWGLGRNRTISRCAGDRPAIAR
jgi:hypothetical protein